ncbi:MAG TPA: nitrilase-related carbon-nitrogen hydrolase [Thermoflexales bacterium]|jgi:N-carbamoylputrescine amidase|nr:nitrilase-related carbon-nitrogen hydrolase [Thermoflexales bacterium]HQZ53044.1 nitrilase-related carbon-nitrogen hydrolase [Thermoflexales bacterium]
MPSPSANPRLVTIGLIQEIWRADPDAHARALRTAALSAAERGAQLICLQELTLHRYFGDVRKRALFNLAEPLEGGPTGALCATLARDTGAFVVGSLYERAPGHLFNTAVIYAPDGHLHGFTRKQHIPRGTGYHEDFYFEPGDSDYPVHDLGFIKLAVPTCYDQWFPELARVYALKGAELIVYPTAIGSEPDHPGFDSEPLWQNTMTAHAIANGVFVAAVNRTGHEGTVRFYGSSFVCEPTGHVLAQASRNEPAVVMATLDFKTMEFWRRLFPLLEQRQPQTYGQLAQTGGRA